MIFRVFNLYKQGKDLRDDPVKFGVDLGRDALSPLFLLPVIMFALLSLGTLALWWFVGWGIFLFLAILFAIGLLFVHGMYSIVSRATAKVENVAHQGFDSAKQSFNQHNSQERRSSHIVDTIAQEK